MAKDSIIYRVCGNCDGDGIVTEPSPLPPFEMEDHECHQCKGSGGVEWGWIEKVPNE